jgi:hypothetical protein
MTKLSEFKQATVHVEALRRLLKFRQSYGGQDSPPQRAVIELDADFVFNPARGADSWSC